MTRWCQSISFIFGAVPIFSGITQSTLDPPIPTYADKKNKCALWINIISAIFILFYLSKLTKNILLWSYFFTQYINYIFAPCIVAFFFLKITTELWILKIHLVPINYIIFLLIIKLSQIPQRSICGSLLKLAPLPS